MDGEPLQRTAEQVFNAPCVEVFSQERMLELMMEQGVNSQVHQSVEELVAERPFDVPKLSSQDRILIRTVEQLSTFFFVPQARTKIVKEPWSR